MAVKDRTIQNNKSARSGAANESRECGERGESSWMETASTHPAHTHISQRAFFIVVFRSAKETQSRRSRRSRELVRNSCPSSRTTCPRRNFRGAKGDSLSGLQARSERRHLFSE